MKVGKAKHGSGKNIFKVETDKDNVFRILPPLGKLADAGRWYQFYRVEWGYKGSDGKQKPFQDVRVKNYQTGMVDVESAAHLRREAIKAKKEETVKAFREGTATKEDVQEMADLMKRYNVDAKYYLNAVTLDGKIGLLKINSTQMNALKAEVEKFIKQGLDPIGVENGIFFSFTKTNATGKIQDWTFNVTPYLKEEKDGSLRRVTHTMDDAFMARLSSEAFELADMYPKITPEQVEQIVAAGDDHAALVDKFLGDSTPSSKAVAPASEKPVVKEETVVKSSPVQEKAVEVEMEATTEEKVVDSEPQQEPKKESMSDEDFLKSIGAV